MKHFESLVITTYQHEENSALPQVDFVPRLLGMTPAWQQAWAKVPLADVGTTS
jgi:hypothetical protein